MFGLFPFPDAAEKGEGDLPAVGGKDLGISQALLSHYENGIREPGLAFVVKACDYYGVSADLSARPHPEP